MVAAAHKVLLDLESLVIHFYSLPNHVEILCAVDEEELLGLALVSKAFRVEKLSCRFQVLGLDREGSVVVLMGQVEQLIRN